MARHTGRFKLGLKQVQLFVDLVSYRSAIGDIRQSRSYNACVVAFACLHFVLSDTRGLNSLEELCITRVAAVSSCVRVLNPRRGAYIGINIYIYIIYHHHRVTPPAQISLTFSRHSSLPSLPAGPPDHILCPYRTAVDKFSLVVQNLRVNIAEHRL